MIWLLIIGSIVAPLAGSVVGALVICAAYARKAEKDRIWMQSLQDQRKLDPWPRVTLYAGPLENYIPLEELAQQQGIVDYDPARVCVALRLGAVTVTYLLEDCGHEVRS